MSTVSNFSNIVVSSNYPEAEVPFVAKTSEQIQAVIDAWAFDPEKYVNTDDFLENVLEALMFDVPQDRRHHPEGSVYAHAIQSGIAARDLANFWGFPAPMQIFFEFVGQIHDIGKVEVTFFNDKKGDWAAPKHERAGEPYARALAEKLYAGDKALQDLVVKLVGEHGFYMGLPEEQQYNPTPKQVKKLMKRLDPDSPDEARKKLLYLVIVALADQMGREESGFIGPFPEKEDNLFSGWIEISETIDKYE